MCDHCEFECFKSSHNVTGSRWLTDGDEGGYSGASNTPKSYLPVFRNIRRTVNKQSWDLKVQDDKPRWTAPIGEKALKLKEKFKRRLQRKTGRDPWRVRRLKADNLKRHILYEGRHNFN